MIGSAGSSEGRGRRPGLLCSGGRLERRSDADGETESVAEQRNPSGMRGSGAGEAWGCAGGVEERETCSDKVWLSSCILWLNSTVIRRHNAHALTCEEGRPVQGPCGTKL